jgi:hypothetical protein
MFLGQWWVTGLQLGGLEMVFKTEIFRACLDYILFFFARKTIQTSARKIPFGNEPNNDKKQLWRVKFLA